MTRKELLERVRERENQAVALIVAADRQPWRLLRNAGFRRKARALLKLAQADLDKVAEQHRRYGHRAAHIASQLHTLD